MNQQFIQIGVTALRSPDTGEYLPAVPLYIEATGSARAGEETLIKDVGKLLADRMRRYVDANKAAGLPV